MRMMRTVMRRTLALQYLVLLIALVNALAGSTLHAWQHVPHHDGTHDQAYVQVHGVAAAHRAPPHSAAEAHPQLPPIPADHETDHGTGHAPCAWCLTHAFDGGLPGVQAAQPPRVAATGPLRAVAIAHHATHPLRWPWASRAPPALS